MLSQYGADLGIAGQGNALAVDLVVLRIAAGVDSF